MTEPHAHAPPTACENCASVLQGHYCHVCGQRAHNPLYDFGHAVEEVFESFWHLDGRIFRTLRDLFVPGRVAAGYLAGHRVRYVAPLRMFIILSVLTFFVGKLTLHIDPIDAIQVNTEDGPPRRGLTVKGDGADESGIGRASTVEEVLRIRAEALAGLDAGAKDEEAGAFLSAIGGFARRQIDERARTRMRALGATPEQMRLLDAPPQALPAATAATASGVSTAPAAAKAREEDRGLFRRWLDHRMTRLRENAEIVQKNPDEFVRLVLGAVPGALFVLVPLFALCLKLLYIRSGRGYLEHLVVALYSHAFMLVALLASFLLIGLQSVPGLPAWGSAVSAVAASFALFLFVPLYLLWMQKRVYAQGWVKTLIKYATLGLVYSVLLGFGIVYAVLAGLSS